MSFRRKAEANDTELATTRGRTGFDGDVEMGIAGGGARPPKNGLLYKLKNDYDYAYAA